MANDLNHRDDFDKLIQSSFAEQPVQADPVVWDNIQAAIAPQKKRVIAWWWYGAAASVALLLTAAVFFLNDDQSRPNSIPAITFEKGAADQKSDAIQNDQESESTQGIETLSSQGQESSNNIDSDLQKRKDNHSIETKEARGEALDPRSIADSDASTKSTVIPSEKNPSLNNSIDNQLSKKRTSTSLIASENGKSLDGKKSNDGNINGLATNDANDHSSEKLLSMPRQELLDPTLAYMPRLGAELPLDLAVVEQLNKRYIPWYEDSYPENLVSESSNFLAANLTSGGAATGALGSSTGRFESNSNIVPTSLEIGATNDYALASDEEINYSPPFVLGLKGALALSKRWYVESGLNYTYLSQKITSEQGFINPTTIVEHYIGVPLLFDFEFVQKRKLSMLASAGWQFEKGLAARSRVEEPNGTGITHLSAPGIQLGWVLGLATEYRINDQIGIYIQPSITYWMYSSAGIQNVRNHSLIWPSLQMGLRYRID